MIKARIALATCAVVTSALVAPAAASAEPASAAPAVQQTGNETVSYTIPCKHGRHSGECHARHGHIQHEGNGYLGGESSETGRICTGLGEAGC
jgi:hypothetical protein